MVQRKAISKLGIHTDSKNSIKPEKGSTSLKTSSSSQYQDMKNRGGTELKKIMKKSRSIKRTDLDTLRFERTPQKPSAIKIPEGSPNYMKPTSSSDARRERLQVSPLSSETNSVIKSPIRRNSNYSKPSNASSNKPVKTLMKKSSLKPIRTLTKVSSFKNSGVALYPKLNVGKATCSSTLKDSKFPPYVMLQPGGTESEGCSIIKVCPYTYCSLNGHHHAPLPPLKRFLSSRRHMLKTQKSMRMKGLTPVGTKSSGEKKKEIDTGQIAFDGDPAIPAISTLTEEADMDFFVEIYAKPREDTNESIGRSIDMDDEEVNEFPVKPGIPDVIILSERDNAETEQVNDDGKVSQCLPDESSYSEISFEENLDQDGDFRMAEMDIGMIFPEPDVEDNLPCLIQEEKDLEFCFDKLEPSESIPEATVINWNDMEGVTPHFDNGLDDSNKAGDGYGLIDLWLSKLNDPDLKSIDIVNDCLEEVTVEGEAPKEVHEEIDDSFDIEYDSDQGSHIGKSSDIAEGFDSPNSPRQGQLSLTEDAFEKPAAISDEQVVDSPISIEGLLEEVTKACEEESEPVDDFVHDNPPLGDNKPNCIIDVVYEAFMEEQENDILQSDPEKDQVAAQEDPYIDSETDQDAATDSLGTEKEQAEDAIELLGFSLTDSSHDFLETREETDKEDHSSNHHDFEVPQSNSINEEEILGQEVVDESPPAETQDCPSNDQSDISNIVDSQELSEKDKVEARDSTDFEENRDSERNESSSADEVVEENKKMQAEESMEVDATELLGFPLTNSSHDFFETQEETDKVDQGSNHHDFEVQQSNSFNGGEIVVQEVVDDSLPAETKDSPSNDQSDISNIVDSQELSEKDKVEAGDSTDFEENRDSERNESSSADEVVEENKKMQAEESMEVDVIETCLTENNGKSPDEMETIINGDNKCDQLPKNCSNMKWTFRGKRSIKDSEEMRIFNPREPRYLPVQPELETETVDLRHQMMDERKNAEEWMLDYAMRQAVNKLTPARKKRVALLVEAFETVMPLPKYETRMRHTTPAFGHARVIQACS